MKLAALIPLICLAGCSWFHRKPPAPDPTLLVVTGAPAGSSLFIDGVQAGAEKESSARPQMAAVTPGMHTVEVRVGGKASYRESTYVAPGEKHLVTVLSGTGRD